MYYPIKLSALEILDKSPIMDSVLIPQNQLVFQYTIPMNLDWQNVECVDSRKMVNGLAAAQEYHSFDYFITFTGNHHKTPGVLFLDQWNIYEEWKSSFPD